jgi:hypothetical protein
MTAKTRIVEHLGETAVLLPRLVADGLAANDRAKLRMTALQAAVRHANDPTGSPEDLSAEARAAGLDPVEIGRTIGEARAAGTDSILAPGAAALQTSLVADVEAMMRAVEASGDEGAATYRKRLDALVAHAAGDDRLRPSAVAAMTTAKPGGPDSLHRLVMDLHKAMSSVATRRARSQKLGSN